MDFRLRTSESALSVMRQKALYASRRGQAPHHPPYGGIMHLIVLGLPTDLTTLNSNIEMPSMEISTNADVNS